MLYDQNSIKQYVLKVISNLIEYAEVGSPLLMQPLFAERCNWYFLGNRSYPWIACKR